MATQAQIEANRRNARKSTGPRTPEGKAVSRLNALKSGIDARSQVIRGESAEELEVLAVEYHESFRPAAPEERFLVDALVTAEWQLRRLRKIEAQLWEAQYQDAARWDRLNKSAPLGSVFMRAEHDFNRLQRRIDSTERAYHRALKELQRRRAQWGRPPGLPSKEGDSPKPQANPQDVPSPLPTLVSPKPQPAPAQSLVPQIGFVPSNPPTSLSRGACASTRAGFGVAGEKTSYRRQAAPFGDC